MGKFASEAQRKAVMASIKGRVKTAVMPEVIGRMSTVKARITRNEFGRGTIVLPDGRQVEIGDGNLKGQVGETVEVQLNTSGSVVNFPQEENKFTPDKE